MTAWNNGTIPFSMPQGMAVFINKHDPHRSYLIKAKCFTMANGGQGLFKFICNDLVRKRKRPLTSFWYTATNAGSWFIKHISYPRYTYSTRSLSCVHLCLSTLWLPCGVRTGTSVMMARRMPQTYCGESWSASQLIFANTRLGISVICV